MIYFKKERKHYLKIYYNINEINMITYFILLTTISTSTISLLFFLYFEIRKYINNKSYNNINKKTLKNDDSNNSSVILESQIKYEDKYLKQIRNNKHDISCSQILDKKIIENYKNNIIIEKTPIGNVAMYYDNNSETFIYYSDNTIPYRFLEVVARKYVITYNCTNLYIDMEKELEKKLLEDKNKESNDLLEKTNSNKIEKKNVFAKFKNYNKEAGSGRVNIAPPPKNNIPSNQMKVINSEKNLLKEESNRYVCKGRFSNFNILQKINRKKIDQKYALSFAEFKKKLIES
jgi:hypothetical protein